MNFSSILTSTMKILNVADKTIPLIKDLNPTISSLKNKFNVLKRKETQPIKEIEFVENEEVKNKKSYPTFFR